MTWAASLLTCFLFVTQSDDPIAELTRKSVLALQEMLQADRDHAEGRFDKAMLIYSKYLEDPDFDPERFISGSGRHLFAADLRISAQTTLPIALEGSGRYKEALAAYESPLKRYGIKGCGNAIMGENESRRAGAARCLAALRRQGGE